MQPRGGLLLDTDGVKVTVQPTIKGSLVTKEILFVPIPIGVEVGAFIDVKNYTALSLFEYSHDFVDEEIPPLTAGDARYFYGFNYSPEEDESVIIRDDDRNIENGISMKLPDNVRELSYMTLNTGARTDIAFDMNGAADIEVPAVLDKLVGSLLVNLPEVTRTGYTFAGWFTAPVGGEQAETQTVPADGIVLYAH